MEKERRREERGRQFQKEKMGSVKTTGCSGILSSVLGIFTVETKPHSGEAPEVRAPFSGTHLSPLIVAPHLHYSFEHLFIHRRLLPFSSSPQHWQWFPKGRTAGHALHH